MSRPAVLASVVLAAAVLAGPAAPRARITPAAFAARADAICADYKQRVARVSRTTPTDLGAVYRQTLVVLVIAREDVAKIDALPLPAIRRAVAVAWVASRNKLVVLLVRLRDAAKRRSASEVASTVAALDANGARGHQLAGRLGMKVCSTGA